MKKKSIIQARKHFKRNKVLQIIRNNSNVSKSYLQEKTSYSMSTVISIVDELIAEGYLYEEESLESRVGRRPVWLKLNPDNAYTVGLEFNGDYMHCVLSNIDGTVIEFTYGKVNRNSSAITLIEQMKDQIEYCMDAVSSTSKILGIGIGVPGYFDEEKGIALNYSTIPQWKNIPILNIIEKAFKIPCYIENNVNVMAFVYKWTPEVKVPDNFMFVSVRTGVRIVPIVNHELVLDQSGSSGQLGHTRVNGRNRTCHCGKKGCLNTEVTESGLISSIVEGYITSRKFENFVKKYGHDFSKITLDMIVSEYHTDSEIKDLMTECAQRLGEALGIMVDIFAPSEVQLSGKIFYCGPEFIEEIRKFVALNSIKENVRKLKIRTSKFSTDIGARGAAAMVMEENFQCIDQRV